MYAWWTLDFVGEPKRRIASDPYLGSGKDLGISASRNKRLACRVREHTPTPRIVSALTPHGARREPLKHCFQGLLFCGPKEPSLSCVRQEPSRGYARPPYQTR